MPLGASSKTIHSPPFNFNSSIRQSSNRLGDFTGDLISFYLTVSEKNIDYFYFTKINLFD